MSLRAGFAEVDITPPMGTRKIGWLREIVGDTVIDPIYARLAVIECGGESIAFVQLDTLSVRWTTTEHIRRRVAEAHGFPHDRVMVSATHNHAGPAIATCAQSRRDDAYVEALVPKIVATFGQALDNRRDAEIGLGSCAEFGISHNRRTVLRDGSARTHGGLKPETDLYVEGPIDPEVAVLAARDADGKLLGAIVNFACHPAHHGGGTGFSAGYPGVLAAEMKQRGCPVTLFLNGACGNISSGDPCRGIAGSMEDLGQRLAEDAARVIEGMAFRSQLHLDGARRTIQLPYRTVTDDEVKGTVRGAQRFIDPKLYDIGMPELIARIRERGTQPAEVQVLFLDEYAFVSIPAEYFVQLALRIKEQAYPRRALVVSCANGMVGYVPTREAFPRGGYETTFISSSRIGPGAGEMLADCAVELIREKEQSQ